MNTQTLFPVTGEDGINYLIDKDTEVKVKDGDLQYFAPTNTIKTANEEYGIHPDAAKIVAVEFPHKIEGLYQFKLPDKDYFLNKVNELKEQSFKGWTTDAMNGYMTALTTLSSIYKANKAKWTDEDVKKAIWSARETYKPMGNGDEQYINSEDEIIQSLHKNKEIESVEVEMEKLFDHNKTGDKQYTTNEAEAYHGATFVWQPKLNKDGLLIISKINYK